MLFGVSGGVSGDSGQHLMLSDVQASLSALRRLYGVHTAASVRRPARRRGAETDAARLRRGITGGQIVIPASGLLLELGGVFLLPPGFSGFDDCCRPDWPVIGQIDRSSAVHTCAHVTA